MSPMNRYRSAISGSFSACVAGLCLFFAGTRPVAAGQTAEVHSGFVFGSLPYSSEGAKLFEREDSRLLIAAFDRGWSLEKFVEETGRPEVEVLTTLDELEQAKLVFGPNDFALMPGLLLIRTPELESLGAALEEDAAEFVRIIKEHWGDVETFVDSLDALKAATHEAASRQMPYIAVVGGVLRGGMLDALMEDRTLMPDPPSRGSSGDYYAWLVEGESPVAPIVTQSARVGRHTVYSVGTGIREDLRIPISELEAAGSPVLEFEDAERWRVFSNIFSRDFLLPPLKARRAALLELHGEIRAGRYTAFAEFAAWYYQELVSRVVRSLVQEGYVVAPESAYTYAIRTGR
jgi:hypothetical protein